MILDVVPRINPGGLVYMDIQQQVSDAQNPTGSSETPVNPRISTRSVSTQVAVQSGQTVLLGGLISRTTRSVSVPCLTWGRSRVALVVWQYRQVQGPHGADCADYAEGDYQQQPGAAGDDDYRQQMQLLRPAQ